MNKINWKKIIIAKMKNKKNINIIFQNLLIYSQNKILNIIYIWNNYIKQVLK